VSSSSPLLVVRDLSAAWEGDPVLHGISFEVQVQELLVLLGPNGSGKTTLLRCLAGLERPTAGSVILAGRDLGPLPTHRRGIGLMFQDPALFPNRSVYENIAYAPLLQRRSRAETSEEVGRLVALLHLDGFEDRRPDQLSGGERQRVALARTLAAEPRLILLDEPFASIDAELKAELRSEFRRVLRSLGIAAIHVTHDREEGLFLGDRVALLFEGRLETVGVPREVYDRPRTARVARFLGYNVLGSADAPEAVHPEDIRLAGAGGGRLKVGVLALGTTGREHLVVARADDGTRVELRTTELPPGVAPGSRINVDWSRSVQVAPDDLAGSGRARGA
jgi:ABC-type Fe3+/spermidine/putrescine transport system ATPase subunit